METARALTRSAARALTRSAARAFNHNAARALRICVFIFVLGVLAACTSLESVAPSLPEGTPSPEETATPRGSEILPFASPTESVARIEPVTVSVTRTPPALSSPTIAPTPTFTSTPLECWTHDGQITRHTLRTPISPLPWEFRVYTPPCYEQQTIRHYPLLILIHGSTFNDDQWDRMGADETADRLIAQGDLPPFLILMPRDRVWTDEPKDDPFGQALVEYLIPWMDENYRTLPEREARAIGGLSRGASWAVHLGLSYWEMFGAVGGHSLPVFVTDPPRLERWLDEIPPGSMPRFFLDIGEKDYLLDNALWFENLLTEKNIPHEWYLYTGRHEEAYWEAHLEQYLRWYAEAWSPLQ